MATNQTQNQEPWNLADDANQVLIGYQSTQIRMSRGEALRFGAAIVTHCSGAQTSRSVSAPAAPAPSPKGKGGGKGRTPKS